MLSPGVILLLTDHPDRSATLVRAIERVADCLVVLTAQPCWQAAPVLGVIVDAGLDSPQARVYLRQLAGRLGPRQPPLLCLTRNTTSAALREARAYGANACLPSHTEPRAATAALVYLIDPQASIAELIVHRGAAQTGRLLEEMFCGAEGGAVDASLVERAIDPVMSAIEEGGLMRWLDVVWQHHDSTFQHSLLVAGLVATFTQSLGFSRADRLLMARGALVHDVGKTQIPQAILNKPGPLDTDEMAVMRTHPVLGYDILRASGCDDPIVLGMTRHHHEMLDGSGYPDALSGDAIADPIRLLTICDIYAALIERRSYKPPFCLREAMRTLDGMVGKLEGALVQAFGDAIAQSGVHLDQDAA